MCGVQAWERMSLGWQEWNYIFWYSKRYFVPNMTKIRFQIKPHIFFLFFMTVFSETLTVYLRFHDFWGYQKLKNKGTFHWNQGYSTEKEGRWISLKPKVFNWEGGWVVFIETKGIRLRRRPSASISVETLGFNETTQPPSQSKPLVSMKPPALLLSLNPWFQWNHL